MRATNFARATYQEVYDIMTKDGKVSIFGFHTPTGEGPYSMLHGFFTQFRKYRYGGMKVNIVPAAQLPADPLQISYEAGTESYIDPRDLQNPVLFHGAHGTNLGEVLNMIYSTSPSLDDVTQGSVDRQEVNLDSGEESPQWDFESWYYSAMLDPSFRKFNVMNNMSLPFMSPRVHNLTTNFALQPSFKDYSSFEIQQPGLGGVSEGIPPYSGTVKYAFPIVNEYEGEDGRITTITPSIKFMTNKLTRLGWMDTFTFPKAAAHDPTGVTSVSPGTTQPTVSPLPKLMMGALIMPPSYRTKLAFRVVIQHYFEFARFNTSITPTAIHRTTGLMSQSVWNYHNWLPEAFDATEANSIDSLNGDVVQSVSGVM